MLNEIIRTLLAYHIIVAENVIPVQFIGLYKPVQQLHQCV